jgi:hypothetical protein
MANSFLETIEKLKGEIENHVQVVKADPAWAQIEKLYRALTTIEDLAEVPQTTLSALFGFAGATSGVSVRPGEFIGMDALEAAKTYLEKKKDVAASLDEIVDALQKGGANLVGRDSLRTSLGRSTWDVVKAPGQELYQLVKHSPHVKRGKKKVAGSSVTAGPATESPANEVEFVDDVPKFSA